MKHSSESKRGAMNITIQQVGSDKEKVLSALQECAEGRFSCPTPQYGKLDAINVRADGDLITLDGSLLPRV